MGTHNFTFPFTGEDSEPLNSYGNFGQIDDIFYDSGYVELHNFESVEMEKDFTELPPILLVSFAVILAGLLLIGVVGNIIVISVLIKERLQEHSRALMPMSTTTNAYILNLSAADLLFLLFCAPFQGTVYILNHWPYGWFMCKVAHYLQFCTVYASIWVLTMMSVDRYVAIGHPLKSVKWRHPRQAMKISAVVWVTAALLSLPWLILYEADERESADGQIRTACYDAWSESTYRYRKWMILFVFLVGFLVPSCVIFYMAILVARSIRSATHQPLLTVHDNGKNQLINKELITQSSSIARQTAKISIGANAAGVAVGVRLRRRRRVGWLVFALAFLFFLCWMPHNLSVVWLNFDSGSFEWVYNNYQTFFIIKLLAHMMTYINSCVNPLLYSLASNHFRGRLAHACGGRLSTTAYNSSYRFDNRTFVQNGPGSLWLRHASTCGQMTFGSPTSIRKASILSAARKKSNSTLAPPGSQRLQRFSLAEWPAQRPSFDFVESKTHSPCQNRLLIAAINKSIEKKKSIDLTSSRSPGLAVAAPSLRLVATPILGAVRMISKRIEVANQKNRPLSLRKERATDCSSSNSGVDATRDNGTSRRCSR